MSFVTVELSTPLSISPANDIKNRFVKGASQEGLANALNDPTPQLDNLYRSWSEGEVGVIISGTTWVNRGDRTPHGDLILDELSDMIAYRRLAKAGQANRSHCWLQLGYCPSLSEAAFNDLDAEEVLQIIQSFVEAAQRAEHAGFSGIQIAAHRGHFLGESLDSGVNQRSDMWGGDSGRRASLLFTVIAEIRSKVRTNFLVSLTLDTNALVDEDGAPANQFIRLLDSQLDTIQLIGDQLALSVKEAFSSAAIIAPAEELSKTSLDDHFDLVAFDYRCALLPNLAEKLLLTPQFEWPKTWPCDAAASIEKNAKLGRWYKHQMYLLSMGEPASPTSGALSLSLRVALVRWRSERSLRQLFN